MPLDAVCLSAVLAELEPEAVGSKIDKIYQTERDEIVLLLRCRGGNRRLMLSAAQGSARLHFTDTRKDNPMNPPMFCMLLRKHLTGAKIASLTQPGLERVAVLSLDCYDELGVPVQKRLILEAIGRSCNLTLVDGDGRIVDCVRRTDGDITAQRRMLPGMFYEFPPTQDKQDFRALPAKRLTELMRGGESCDRWILNTFFGISPLVARELCFRAGVESERISELDGAQKERLAAQLIWLGENILKGEPWLLTMDGEAKDFSFMPILQYGAAGQSERADSFSALLDSFYARRDMGERMRQRGREAIRSVKSARDRTRRKLENQREELKASLERDYNRRAGDIITANIYAMQRGMTVLKAVDFYDPEGGEVEIRLDPLKTPQQNAAAYYKTYTKLRTAEKYLREQIAKNESELYYLESALDELERAEGENELDEIRRELEQSGYLKNRRKVKQRPQKTAPLSYRSSSGLRIAVGKNNTQNDELTLRTAYKSDIWLHTQKIHGSHVILFTEGREPDAQSITEAAILAAWHSQARGSGNVPVDYTPVRYVKKPNGARAGMVIYETYNTAWVTPDESTVNKLKD